MKDVEKLRYYCTYLKYDYQIRSLIYTTNWIERLNKAFKKVIKNRNSMSSPTSVLTLLSKVSIDMGKGAYKYKINKLSHCDHFNNV